MILDTFLVLRDRPSTSIYSPCHAQQQFKYIHLDLLKDRIDPVTLPDDTITINSPLDWKSRPRLKTN
jgi:hypothetical protein